MNLNLNLNKAPKWMRYSAAVLVLLALGAGLRSIASESIWAPGTPLNCEVQDRAGDAILLSCTPVTPESTADHRESGRNYPEVSYPPPRPVYRDARLKSAGECVNLRQEQDINLSVACLPPGVLVQIQPTNGLDYQGYSYQFVISYERPELNRGWVAIDYLEVDR